VSSQRRPPRVAQCRRPGVLPAINALLLALAGLLQRGLVDELDMHISPVQLGDGIRLFDNPGGTPIGLELRNGDDPAAEVNLRYHPIAAA
jgi:hypothetical protein